MPTNDKLKNFLSSTALVIDDEIIYEESTISRIVAKLEEHGTFFVKRTGLISNIDSLSNVSFVILDWDLTKKEKGSELPAGVSLGATLIESQKEEIISFIKDVVNNYFIPVFIFSREDTEEIKKHVIKDEQLKNAIEKSKIYICNKSTLKDEHVILSLNDWLNNSMAVYTFKIMEESIEKAKHKFFNEMFECNPYWPCHVYKTLKKDNSADINSDFQEFLMTSYVSTIEPIQFDNDGFDRDIDLGKEEVLKIYSKIKFFEYSSTVNVGPHSGDLYVAEDDNNDYYINITAPCDMRRDEYYFIRGNSNIDKDNPTRFYKVPKLHNKDAICFDLRKVKIFRKPADINKLSVGEKKNKMNFKRIGRLLPPYINALQRKYAHFVTRPGEWRDPDQD